MKKQEDIYKDCVSGENKKDSQETPDSSFLFPKSSDKRDKQHPSFNHKLDIALSLSGFKEISEFAEKTDYSRSFISKVLHGRINPTLAQAQDICNVLELHIWKVFDPNQIRDLDGGKNE